MEATTIKKIAVTNAITAANHFPQTDRHTLAIFKDLVCVDGTHGTITGDELRYFADLVGSCMDTPHTWSINLVLRILKVEHNALQQSSSTPES